jgi:hypothetical protein
MFIVRIVEMSKETQMQMDKAIDELEDLLSGLQDFVDKTYGFALSSYERGDTSMGDAYMDIALGLSNGTSKITYEFFRLKWSGKRDNMSRSREEQNQPRRRHPLGAN